MFSIVWPCQYMQNLKGGLPRILQEGVFALPWSPDRKMVPVDVEDMGEDISDSADEAGVRRRHIRILRRGAPVEA